MSGAATGAIGRFEVDADGARGVGVVSTFDELLRYFGTLFSLREPESGPVLLRGDDQPPEDEFLVSGLVPASAYAKSPPSNGNEDLHPIVLRKDPVGSDGGSRLFLTDVVRVMSSAIDAKGPCMCGHSDRVARLSVRLAQQIGWPPELLADIYLAGLLHDIGKLRIDTRLLRKPEPLTDLEYMRVKLHPAFGYRMLVGIDRLSAVLPGVLYHHEQWDGRGYPDGLAGERIPEIARIIAVADAHDAMISDRPYRAGMPRDIVHRAFLEGAGVFWDPRVVQAYFQVQQRTTPARDLASKDREISVGSLLCEAPREPVPGK